MSKALFNRLRDEADLCANDGAGDIARLLNEAADALTTADSRGARRWIERWNGSGPDRGWWVWEAGDGDSIAWCGEGNFAQRMCSLIVEKHNSALGYRP